MGKNLGLDKGGLYSGMVHFVRWSDTGSPLYIIFSGVQLITYAYHIVKMLIVFLNMPIHSLMVSIF